MTMSIFFILHRIGGEGEGEEEEEGERVKTQKKTSAN